MVYNARRYPVLKQKQNFVKLIFEKMESTFNKVTEVRSDSGLQKFQ